MKHFSISPRLRAPLLAAGLFFTGLARAGAPSSVSRCYSDVRVHPETGDTGGYRLHLVFTMGRASGAVDIFQGSSTPVRIPLTGSLKNGSTVVSSAAGANTVPFTISGVADGHAFSGTIVFDRGTTTDSEALRLPTVPLKACLAHSRP